VCARIIERGLPVGHISFFPQPKQRARWTEVNRSCAGHVRFRRTSVVWAELRNGSAGLILVQVFKYLCGATFSPLHSKPPAAPSLPISPLPHSGRERERGMAAVVDAHGRHQPSPSDPRAMFAAKRRACSWLYRSMGSPEPRGISHRRGCHHLGQGIDPQPKNFL
jgi:hypothetical protein